MKRDRSKDIENTKRWRIEHREQYLEEKRKENKKARDKRLIEKGLEYMTFLSDEDYKKERKRRSLEKIKISVRANKKKSYYRNKEYIWEYKSAHPCEKCGEKDPACLVFHHIDPTKKDSDVPKLTKRGFKKLKDEIEKCQILCANCHNKLHYYQKHTEEIISEGEDEKAI